MRKWALGQFCQANLKEHLLKAEQDGGTTSLALQVTLSDMGPTDGRQQKQTSSCFSSFPLCFISPELMGEGRVNMRRNIHVGFTMCHALLGPIDTSFIF